MRDVERLSAEQVLAHVIERHERVAIACSFQKEASVIMHMATRISPSVRFFTLDTGLHFPETYATWRALEERYGVKVEGMRGITLDEQRAVHGDRLWETDPDLCCEIRKVVPMRDRLANADAWVAGLRRDQSPDRADTPKLHWDDKYSLWKANPRFRVDRLRAVHRTGNGPSGALGGHRQGRVRPARGLAP